MSSRAAARVAGEATSRISQAIAPPTVAHRKPVRCQPSTTVAAAIATRMTASVTISAPYWVHWLMPANMPSRVVCTQKPASPAHSSATDNQRSSTKTRPLHSGAVPAITTAAATPSSAPTRSGWVRLVGATSR